MEQGVMETVEVLEGLERQVHFAVSSAEVSKQVAARLARLARTTAVPGFRPGKVPMKIIAATHGRSTRLDVLSELVSDTFNRILNDQQLRMAGEPTIEPEKELAPDQTELRFRARFEVFPEVEVEGIEQIEIEQLDVPLGDADVDQTIDVMRRKYATWIPTDAPAARGDRLVIDLEDLQDDGSLPGSSTPRRHMIELGRSVLEKGFEEGLLGRSKGECVDLALRLSDDDPAQGVVGRILKFRATIHEVSVPELPPLDTDFALALGIADGDLAVLRSEVRRNLDREVKQRIGDRIKAQVMAGLAKLARFEVPRAFVEAETNDLMEKARKQAAEFGGGNNELKFEAEQFAQLARERVEISLIIRKLVSQHNLEARPQQVRQIVERISTAYEKPAELIRHYMSDRERMAHVERIAIEDNVVDFVLARAKVVPRTIPLKDLLPEAQLS